MPRVQRSGSWPDPESCRRSSGRSRAVDYLVEGLVDDGGRGVDRFRCAQALCDVFGWPFEWYLDHVEQTAARVRAGKPLLP